MSIGSIIYLVITLLFLFISFVFFIYMDLKSHKKEQLKAEKNMTQNSQVNNEKTIS